jgi:RNA polymerase sigma factor (sigma-70 family)
MVWGVCRRLLNQEDAEDAFQATFLVLVRKAASIVPRERVANWLYGVAHQTALQASRTAARRRAREKQVTEMPEPAVLEQDLWRDLQPLLDQELSRLPNAYREVIVLCDLEGKARKEAARQLGLPEGTVGSRLARARTMLAKRLTQQGIALSGGVLAAVLCEQGASAGVPPAVVSSTIKAASSYAAGQAAGTSAIPAKALGITEGVLRAMSLQKLKTVCVVLLLMVLAAGAVTWLVRPIGGSALHAQTPDIQSKVQTKLELQRLKGIWRPVAVVALEEGADDKNLLNRTRLIIKDDTFRVVTLFDLEMPVKEKLQVVVMEGRLEIDPEKTPKTMDWRVQNPKLKYPILKVYEVDGDKLKIVTGSATDRPSSLKQGMEGTKTVFYQRDTSLKKAYEQTQLSPTDALKGEKQENLYPGVRGAGDKKK